MNDELIDVGLLKLDWENLENLSEKERQQIVNEYTRSINLAKKTIKAEGSYTANIRSLVIMLLISLVMALQGLENRTIALTVVGFQFIKTIVSRLIESNLQSVYYNTKQELIELMKKKSLF